MTTGSYEGSELPEQSLLWIEVIWPRQQQRSCQTLFGDFSTFFRAVFLVLLRSDCWRNRNKQLPNYALILDEPADHWSKDDAKQGRTR